MRNQLIVAVWLAACGAAEPERESRTSEAMPPATSCKPEPPVGVRVTARPLAGDRHEVTLVATPTAPVGSIELVLLADGGTIADARFAATQTNAPRTLVAYVAGARAIHAIARVPVDGVVMSRTSTLALVAERTPVTKTYQLADGERARELRP